MELKFRRRQGDAAIFEALDGTVRIVSVVAIPASDNTGVVSCFAINPHLWLMGVVPNQIAGKHQSVTTSLIRNEQAVIDAMFSRLAATPMVIYNGAAGDLPEM
jgi:hypothetical protein